MDRQTIYDALDRWIVQGGLSKADVTGQEEFMKEIGGYVDQLSLVPQNDGEKLILYSGHNDEIAMWKAAHAASQTEAGYYYISSTEAGKMLNDDDFISRIELLCEGDKELIAKLMGYATTGRDGVIENPHERYAVGEQLTFNDRISARLVENATGEILH